LTFAPVGCYPAAMKRTGPAAAFVLLAASSCLGASALDTCRGAYAAERAKITADSLSRRSDLRDAYTNALAGVAEGTRKSGDLDGLMAVRKEAERFSRDPDVAAESVVTAPPALRALQEGYRAAAQGLAVERARRDVALAERYAASLEVLKKRLTQEGKIEEAVAVKQEMDALAASEDLAAARALAPPASPREPRPAADPEAGGLKKDLVLHLTFDEDVGAEVRDASGRRNHASWVGASAYEESPAGKAARFASYRTYILCPSKDLNTDGWPAASVSLWVLFRGYTTYGRVLSRGQVTGDQYGGFPHIAVGGRSGARWTGGGFFVLTDKDAIVGATPDAFAKGVQPFPALGVWYHVAGTFDGKVARVYVNGKPDGISERKARSTPLWDTPDTQLVIGTVSCASRINWPDQFFNGLVDDLMIWKRALSEREIGDLYRNSPFAALAAERR
jgi:hypothetical protein